MCCQGSTEPPWPGADISHGMTYTYGMPRRVRKSRWGLSAGLGGQPWVVTNHPAGPMTFRTWREAMDYASAPYVMMNMAMN